MRPARRLTLQERSPCARAVAAQDNLHLINGLFDCHRDRVPVIAIAAQVPDNEIGSGYFQETHPEYLFKDLQPFTANWFRNRTRCREYWESPCVHLSLSEVSRRPSSLEMWRCGSGLHPRLLSERLCVKLKTRELPIHRILPSLTKPSGLVSPSTVKPPGRQPLTPPSAETKYPRCSGAGCSDPPAPPVSSRL